MDSIAQKSTSLNSQIATFFLETLDTEVTDFDFDLIESGYLDSLGLVELLLHLENNFGIEFSIEELELDNFRTINSITNFIQIHQ